LGEAEIYNGTFYKCQGGWNRQSENDCSIIIRIEQKNTD
jgi:hypothetical protein